MFFANRLGDTNYYHWLTEMLPHYLGLPSNTKPLLFNPTTVQIDCLNTLTGLGLVDEGYVSVLTDGPCAVAARSVLYPKFPNYHHLTEKTIDLVNSVKSAISSRFIENPFSIAFKSSKKILYSSRGGSRIKNESLLIEFLEEMGVLVVDNSKLSFLEQCQVFMCADAVIGVHGANLSNCIFMNKGSTVIELMSTKLMNRVFAINSSLLGLNHKLIFDDSENWDFVVDNNFLEMIENFLHDIE